MHIPRATYRLQFTPEFGFKEAAAIVPYLAALGISDMYASPIFRAVPGSLHGYDVTDPNRLNPELGTREDFEALATALKENRMGWLQDIVPNHTAFHPENRMLMDVLEKGDQSEFADFFDIRNHTETDARTPVVTAVLADSLEKTLEQNKIRIVYDHARLRVKYYGKQYPLCWESYAEALMANGFGSTPLGEYVPVLESREEPAASKEETLTAIWDLYRNDSNVKNYIDTRLAELNGPDRNAGGFGTLRHLLSRQHFRLACWKDANTQTNYRRFFYLNEFICLKMARREVFERIHRFIFELVEAGMFQGLRVDHIDGLYQPLRYLQRLRERFDSIYIVVEKILGLDEKLPVQWPVQGTTGYDFLNFVNGLFCNPKSQAALTEFYESFTGARQDWDDILRASKLHEMRTFMECDLSYLAQLAASAIRERGGKPPPLEKLRQALMDVIAEMDVYRTYMDDEMSVEDQRRLESALDKAASARSGNVRELKLIRSLLLAKPAHTPPAGENDHFVMRFQQLTGPVAAKGMEDTCFYRYHRLLSLNEVGGNPQKFGISPREFDAFIGERAWTFGFSMNATSTHDTKRGEDARARITVLSEIPDLWRQAVERWAAMNESFRSKIGNDYAPCRNDEYMLYQIMIGSYPADPEQETAFVQRLKAVAIKSVREAKVHTNWTGPNSAYEDAVNGFIEGILNPRGEFVADFRQFGRQTTHFGIFNSLSGTLIKLTAPGVPDIYQGSEVWNLSMVDPDNRRSVNYDEMQQTLSDIRYKTVHDTALLLDELLENLTDGRIKMYLTWKVLHLRAGFRDLFERGDYVPLEVRGSLKDSLLAYARIFGERTAVIAVPRFLTGVIDVGQIPTGDVWEDTEIILPQETMTAWYDCFTEKRLDIENRCPVSELLAGFPAACIVNAQQVHLKTQAV